MPIRRAHAAILIALLALIASLACTVRIYNGVNKGITVVNCGVEIVGTPGFFCGDY